MDKQRIPSGRDRDKLIALKRGWEFFGKEPLYSTDRNDTWGLWDELPFEYKYDCLREWALSEYDSNVFADAVSLAWLKWWYSKYETT
jgi:hypothetical protein